MPLRCQADEPVESAAEPAVSVPDSTADAPPSAPEASKTIEERNNVETTTAINPSVRGNIRMHNPAEEGRDETRSAFKTAREHIEGIKVDLQDVMGDLFGSFISWMSGKTKPVFIVATANDVSQLRREMLRTGRWDQLFFVDLPNEAEREDIWSIQITEQGRDAEDYDTRRLAKATEGLTGSEIEAVFIESLYQAFNEEEEPTDFSIARVLTEFVPSSKTMAEQINGLRNWAKGRARFATAPMAESKLRKLAEWVAQGGLPRGWPSFSYSDS
jgi:SpoVK/Ycf46/Vps4 family AAA+-type ATPase